MNKLIKQDRNSNKIDEILYFWVISDKYLPHLS